ncbi:MAG: hypothetical protein U9N35_00135 [Euryarchaeota archaeon]|nr:hypothetical protein [Euryarchaeota archaeon]
MKMEHLKSLKKNATTKKSIFSFLVFFLISSYLAGVTENYVTDEHFQRWIDPRKMEVPKNYPMFTPEGEEIAQRYLPYSADIYNSRADIDIFSWVPYHSDYLYPRRSNYMGVLNAVVNDALFEKTKLMKVEPLDEVKDVEKFEEELKKKYLANTAKYYEKPSLEYIDSMVPEIIDENLIYELYTDTQSNLKTHMGEEEYIKAFADYNILESLNSYLRLQGEEREFSVEYMAAFIHDLRISIPLTIAAWMLYLACIIQMKIKNSDGVDRRFSTDNE